MEKLPPRGRPVTEGENGVVSPDELERLKGHLKKQYKVRPTWRSVLSQQHPPTHKQMRHMIDDLDKFAGPLHGAKVLYLDDGPQFFMDFVTRLTLATRRRIERYFYHGETIEEIVAFFRGRLQRCPSPHLLIVDGRLEMLPSLETADHSVYGYDVLAQLSPHLREAGVPAIGFSTIESLHKEFEQAGADGFVRKTIPALSAVETVATIYAKALERIRRRRDEEFIMQD